ncbi:hypothetical protein Val02_03170 [Virgisporangium aliadipatigenens]|uniref:Mycothiol-dependent maleylpyruvate isomerase metal-binding domain-containing protein n=1 Tax=Virgisporangium aliadipatigenens TaxID=741659 RepID=A0A8J3YGA0_9ACTN|nr:maleylpyruvate isomerase family mycothiol-dependent enzyme [Virgisporangium aliadipatigenens]GIJ43431.1 hypothetical protein Val02_03170 [Virgisporangium aliadipatigenens]
MTDHWSTVDQQRTAVADLLDGLSDAEWAHPSLCPMWTVRDVAAHLTLQELGLRDLPALLRSVRGSLDRTTAHMARRRAAALPPERLVAAIRATVGSRRHNLGVTPMETLIDILVHTQDIAIPLGRHVDMPPEACAAAADRMLSMRWPPPPPSVRRMAGFRLVATDCSWTAGVGPEVRGPMGALLLVCAGRYAALDRVSGAGAVSLGADPAPAADTPPPAPPQHGTTPRGSR